MAKRPTHQPQQQTQRRGSQAFRSRELLASLTLSAEAITIGDHPLPLREATSGPSRAPRLGLARVSQMKVAALQMRQRARKERRHRRSTALPVTAEHETAAAAAEDDETVVAQPHTTAAKTVTRQPIGSFDTADVKWSALVAGEIETFMYPSLRLEALYNTTSNTAVTEGSQQERSSNSSSSSKHLRLAAHLPLPNDPQPSAEAVDAAMTPTAKVEWTLTKRYENASQSAPLNGHPRVQEPERQRLQFDQQLEVAECMLRKKELVDGKKRSELMSAPERGNTVRTAAGRDDTPVLDDVACEAERIRSASLYHARLADEPMLIPRLPQTRKYVRTLVFHQIQSLAFVT